MKKYWKIGIAGAAVVAGLLVGIKIHAVNTETKDVPEEIYEESFCQLNPSFP